MSRAAVQSPQDSQAAPVPAHAASAPETTGTSTPEGAPADTGKKKRERGAAPKVALVVVLFLFGTLAWHVATDLMAPSSSTGAVNAFTAQIAPRVAGQIDEVLVVDNQYVEAGTPLFALDPAPFDLAVRQAEVNLSQVLQTVDASVISLASAQARVTQAEIALENTRTQTESTLAMSERGLVPQSQVNAAQAQLANAEAALEAAQADLESAQFSTGEDTQSHPQVQAAQVQLEQAMLNRAFATVTAPTDGLITNLRLAVGQFVNAGTPALTFIEGNRPWVVVDMRENQLANISVGDQASILFDAVPGHKFEGRVRGIAWGIDPGRTAANGLPQNLPSTRWFEPARSIPVHIELVEEQEWPANVRIGSKASALVYATGTDNPVAAVASFFQTISAYLSYLY